VVIIRTSACATAYAATKAALFAGHPLTVGFFEHNFLLRDALWVCDVTVLGWPLGLWVNVRAWRL